MKTLLMMRTRGLIQPFIVKKGHKPATVKSPKGVKTVGPFIVYKQNNP